MIELGDFRYDPESRLLYRGDEEILLPPRVIAVLESLLKRPSKVVPKEDLLASAWDGTIVGEHSLTQAVSKLRQVLGDDPQRPVYIQTVPRRGYRLICDVSEPLERDSDAGGPGQPSGPDAGTSLASADGSRPGGPHLDVEQLRPGSQLGRYEILGALGSGAMGDVWHARDPELGREVALKLMPPHLTNDPTAMGRFRREAQLLAALEHPCIAKIYTVETVASTRFIVMELVEGETLAEKLDDGALPVEEALELAVQIARALEAAHRNGVVHRDLKPANVMVTGEEQVKLLDFGLAKQVRARTTQDGSDPVTMTGADTTLGTAPYMSPEQARGEEVDDQTDIWAFGCVVYELLSGARAFAAETPADTVAAVLKDEPDWEALPEATPAPVVTILRRCLHRDPDRRLHHIADARIEIEVALQEPPSPEGQAATAAPGWWPVAALGAAAVTIVVVGVAAWSWSGAPTAEPRGLKAFSLELPDGAQIPSRVGSAASHVAISPNGEHLAYVVNTPASGNVLWHRRMSQLDGRIVGVSGFGPFFSPDSRWLGFIAGHQATIMKVSLLGGERSTLVSSDGRAATWATDDTVVFSENRSLFTVRADGGDPQLLVAPERETGETFYVNPERLPGRRAVVFEIRSGPATSTLATVDFDERRVQTLPIQGSAPRYAETGHLVFSRAGSLFAVPFDIGSLSTTGDPIEVLPGVRMDIFSQVHYDISDDGSLVFIPGETPSSGISLLRVDRQGNETRLTDHALRLADLRLSPGGTRMAMRRDREERSDIWVYEMASDTFRRLTDQGRDNRFPVWSRDGDWILFASDRSGHRAIFRKRADFSDASAELVVSMEGGVYPNSVSTDGRLLFTAAGDIWWTHLEDGADPRPFLRTGALEAAAEVSPDGTLVAYVSDESGRNEVYVRPFPEAGGSVQVSNEGGIQPIWSRDGKEIYYRLDTSWVAAEIEAEPQLRVVSRTVLFERPRYIGGSLMSDYDITADGDIVVPATATATEAPDLYRIVVVLNWFEELERLVPTNR